MMQKEGGEKGLELLWASRQNLGYQEDLEHIGKEKLKMLLIPPK